MSACRRRRGFTLVEIMVALSVATILVILLSTMVSSAADSSARILSRLSTQQDARVTLDYLERDLAGLTPAEPGRTTLTIVPESVTGLAGGPPEISSIWVLLLSRPLSGSEQGAIRAVSYRLVFIDPMTPGGENRRLALYRTRLVPSGDMAPVLGVADLHGDFWEDYWAVYEAADGGRTLVEDYLAENIVGLGITLNFLDASGTPTSVALPDDTTVSWTSEGFEGGSIATPNSPISITLNLTSLSARGSTLYETGGLPLDEAIRRHGDLQSRTIPVRVGGSN